MDSDGGNITSQRNDASPRGRTSSEKWINVFYEYACPNTKPDEVGLNLRGLLQY